METRVEQPFSLVSTKQINASILMTSSKRLNYFIFIISISCEQQISFKHFISPLTNFIHEFKDFFLIIHTTIVLENYE